MTGFYRKKSKNISIFNCETCLFFFFGFLKKILSDLLIDVIFHCRAIVTNTLCDCIDFSVLTTLCMYFMDILVGVLNTDGVTNAAAFFSASLR